jgi:hypothetical protein
MSGENPDDMTKEELLEYVEKLEENERELENQVARLTQEVTSKRGRRGSGKQAEAEDDLQRMEEENLTLRDQLSNKEVEINQLKETRVAAEARRELAEAAKKDADTEIAKLKKTIDELSRNVQDLSKKSSTADNLSKTARDEKKKLVEESMRLFKENETIRRENDDLHAEVQRLNANVDDRDIALEKLHEALEQTKQSKESGDVHFEDAQNRILELERELKEANDQLKQSVGKEREWEEERANLKNDYKGLATKLSNQLAAAEKEAKEYKKKVQELSVTNPTAIGEKVRQIETLQQEKAVLEADLERLTRALEQEEQEKEVLAHTVMDYKKEINQKVRQCGTHVPTYPRARPAAAFTVMLSSLVCRSPKGCTRSRSGSSSSRPRWTCCKRSSRTAARRWARL